jgi:hypothetical protein
MAPNLAHSMHDLIRIIIESKLQGDKAPTDDKTTEIAGCTPRTARRIRSNMLFRCTEALSNGPPMLTSLRDQLALDSCMSLNEMAAFLQKLSKPT